MSALKGGSFLDRLNFKTKILLGIAVIVLVVLLFFFLVYQGQTNKIVKLTGELANLDQQMKLLQETSKNKKEMDDRVKQLEDEIRLIATVLPDTKEIPELLKNVSSSGRMAGLDFLLFEPKPEIKRDYVVEIPIDVKVQGTFFETANFFYQISKLSRVVNVQNFKIGEGVVKDRGIVLTSSFSIRTFRLLTEAEIKEREDQKKEEMKNKEKKEKQIPKGSKEKQKKP